MLKTKFPYEHIDFDKYYDAYMKQEDAIKSIPTEEELKEIAHKGIIKDHLVLAPLPQGTKAKLGDTITFRTESEIPKFNKEKVTVSIGRGLYNKDLECMAEGKQAGDSYQLTIQDKPVKVTLLELKRKQTPTEPTDEMVVELQTKDNEGKLLTTVAEYEKFIATEKTMETLATINYYVMEKLLEDYPMTEYDEDDIARLRELEHDFFVKMYKETEDLDVENLTVEQAHETWGEEIDSFEAFLDLRYDWYKMKIQQCLIYRNILGLEADPKFDYTDHYEVLSELSEKMFDLIKQRLSA